MQRYSLVRLMVLMCTCFTICTCWRATTLSTTTGENFTLLIDPAKIELNDEQTRLVNVKFVLASSRNHSSGTSNVDSVAISAFIYSEWTAKLDSEYEMVVPMSKCRNGSLCGSTWLSVQPLRLGRASLLMVLRFTQTKVKCAAEIATISEQTTSENANEKHTQAACDNGATVLSATARRSLPVVVVHDRDIFDKIFRYTTISFVLFLTFLMGTQLNIDEMRHILRRPLAPCVGVSCQYIAMPLLAIGICQLFFSIPSAYSTAQYYTEAVNRSDLMDVDDATTRILDEANEAVRDAMLAFGLLALGCAPGGGASNTWTVLLGGDLQMSMTLTFLSTLLSFGMMPFWLFCLTPFILRHLPRRSADALLRVDAYVSDLDMYADEVSAEHQLRVPYMHVVYQLICFVLPCVCGVLLRKYRPCAAARLTIPLKCISGFFVLFMVTYGMWVHRYVFHVVADDPRLLALTAALPHFGFVVGYLIAMAVLRNRPQSIAISIETGVQNMSIAVLIVKYNLPSPAADLGTVVLIIIALVGPLLLYIVFTVLLVRRRFAQRRALRLESDAARDALHVELAGAKPTHDDMARLTKEATFDAETKST